MDATKIVDANGNNQLSISKNGAVLFNPVPLNTSPVLVAGSGNAAQAATNINANAAIVPANTVFTGNVALCLSASQSSAVTAAGTSKLIVSWVPGAGGTSASSVAEIDVNFGVSNASDLASADQGPGPLCMPVVVYAGTTAGTFQVAVIETGTVSSRLWSCSVTGIAQ